MLKIDFNAFEDKFDVEFKGGANIVATDLCTIIRIVYEDFLETDGEEEAEKFKEHFMKIVDANTLFLKKEDLVTLILKRLIKEALKDDSEDESED